LNHHDLNKEGKEMGKEEEAKRIFLKTPHFIFFVGGSA